MGSKLTCLILAVKLSLAGVRQLMLERPSQFRPTLWSGGTVGQVVQLL